MAEDPAVLRSGPVDPTSSMDVEQTVRSQSQFAPATEDGVHYYLNSENRISGTTTDCVIDLGRAQLNVTKVLVAKFDYNALNQNEEKTHTEHQRQACFYLHIEEFAHNSKNMRVATDTGVTRVDNTAVAQINWIHGGGQGFYTMSDMDAIKVDARSVHQLHISLRWADNLVVVPTCFGDATASPATNQPWYLELVLFGNPDLGMTR